MDVKQLKKFLEGMPDDALIVVSGYDHSYDRIRRPRLLEAETDGDHLGETYGNVPSGWEVIPIVVFS